MSTRPRPDWRVALTGLRNPWRFAFDPALARSGSATSAKTTSKRSTASCSSPTSRRRTSAGTPSKATAGPTDGDFALDRAGELVWPVAAYTHEDGCSVTGGYVYRGTAIAPLQGRYLYGDFCSGALWTLTGTPAGGADDVRRERAQVQQLTHIGPDADGEPLFASAAGTIFRAVPRP